MLRNQYPFYIANEARMPNTDLVVINKFTGEVAAKVARADDKAIDEAIGWAVKARDAMRHFPRTLGLRCSGTVRKNSRSVSKSWPMDSASKRENRLLMRAVK